MPKVVTFTPDMDAIIRKMSEVNPSAPLIAAAIGMPEHSVRQRQRLLGIRINGPGVHLYASKGKDMAGIINALAATGMSTTAMARELPLSHKTIQRHRSTSAIARIQEEWSMPPTMHATPQQIDYIRTARARDASWTEICHHLRVSETLAVRWAVEHLGYQRAHKRQPVPGFKPRAKIGKPEPEQPKVPRDPSTGQHALPAGHPITMAAIDTTWDQFHTRLMGE